MVIFAKIYYVTTVSSLLNKIGQNIINYRKKRGLSQEELASRLNVATSTLSAWENGKAFFTYTNLSKLCHALEISEEDLFSFCAVKGMTNNSTLNEIISLSQQISPSKQKQVIEILKTFIG